MRKYRFHPRSKMVQEFHVFEILLLDVDQELVVDVDDLVGSDGLGKHRCKNRK